MTKQKFFFKIIIVGAVLVGAMAAYYMFLPQLKNQHTEKDKLTEEKSTINSSQNTQFDVIKLDAQNNSKAGDLMKGRLPLTAEALKQNEITVRYIDFKETILKLANPNQRKSLNPSEVRKLDDEIKYFFETEYIGIMELFVLKSMVLSTQYSGGTLDAKLENLAAEILQLNEKLLKENDPTKDPKFVEYKNQEKNIIEEAKNMKIFPNGMTMEQYILKRIEGLNLN